MLPSSPLHHLLAHQFESPLVVTSGNLHEQPLITQDQEALDTLQTVAEAWLIHNRPIARALEDSVMRVIGDIPTVLRNGRGISPTLLKAPDQSESVLALGNDLNNSIALLHQESIIQSQYIGDLSQGENRQHFSNTLKDFCQLYQASPSLWLHDLHPDAFTSRYAKTHGTHCRSIPHHQAHAYACMAEHQLLPPVLAFAWDGNGLSEEGLNVGSEVYRIEANGITKAASFRAFPLLGGDKAAKEPFRVAYTLVTLLGSQLQGTLPYEPPFFPDPSQQVIFRQMLQKNLQCPSTTSAGRLFDAVACILGLCSINHYQGQAAMALEQLADQSQQSDSYPLEFYQSTSDQIDWAPIILGVINDQLQGVRAADIAAKFHNTLATLILTVAKQSGMTRIVLSGGCFQNAHLVRKVQNLLPSAGYELYLHQKVPPNDSGLSVGQIYRQIVTIPS
jgi:hydrogenase maturation protein HypF